MRTNRLRATATVAVTGKARALGALSPMQQVGNALGVAVTGAVFYGAIGDGYAAAFGGSMAQLAALLLVVALLARLVPGRQDIPPGRKAA
jgi:hypothetical protein